MNLIEEIYPEMCCLGCVAHCLSLLIKDYAKRFVWLDVLYEVCITISNLANQSESTKAALHRAMIGSNGVVHAICTHVEAHFGSRHFVVRDIKQNWMSITACVVSNDF